MNTKISITTQTYFGDHFYYTGWALLASGIPVLVIKWYVGIIFLMLAALLLTSVYKLVIDVSSKKVDDYLYILGMKKDLATKDYNKLYHVSIKSGRYSQQLQLRAASTIIEGTMYSAYLISDQESFYLGESKSKKKITKKARDIAVKLNVQLKELHEDINTQH